MREMCPVNSHPKPHPKPLITFYSNGHHQKHSIKDVGFGVIGSYYWLLFINSGG
jgi:hypothetical protein